VQVRLTNRAPYNSLTVQCPFTEARGNPLTRVFGRIFNRDSRDVVIESTAVLDQRVCGVCPTGERDSRVQMLPLIVDPRSWVKQACQGRVQVRVRVHGKETGNGCMLTLVPSGPSANGSGPPANGSGPPFPGGSAEAFGAPLHAAQVAPGLSAADLSALGGEFSLRGGALDVRAAPASAAALVRVAQSLGGLNVNDVLVVPLGEQTSPTSRRITALAAGVVLKADYNGTQQELAVEVAPALLTTAAALVDAGEPINPYIGKLYLID
jgi:hypothetical protein